MLRYALLFLIFTALTENVSSITQGAGLAVNFRANNLPFVVPKGLEAGGNSQKLIAGAADSYTGANVFLGGIGATGLVRARFNGYSTLAVDFKYTKVHYSGQSRETIIQWATLKEVESSHFIIERSVNGIGDWHAIGEVPGMGSSDRLSKYSFHDLNLPVNGGKIYYRLKQVDLNSSSDYSNTIMVSVPSVKISKGEWRAYPNPAKGSLFHLNKNGDGLMGEEISIRILSSQNQIGQFSAANEHELNEQLRDIFSRVPKGLFIIEVQWDGQVEYVKVIKL